MAALGMRGTGKTTLITECYKSIMNSYPNACGYVLDSNAAGDFSGWSGGYFGFDCPIISPGPAGRQVVWQPRYDDSEAYEDFFRRLFDATAWTGIPAVVLIDELAALGKGDHQYYARILKRGRRRAGFAGITLFSISQELAQKANVPRQTFSQMNHMCKFYVQHPYDLMMANKLLHLPDNVQPEHEHGFWHARLDAPPIKPTYYESLKRLGF